MNGGPVPRDLDDQIEAAITSFPGEILDIGTGLRPPLVIKYVSTRCAAIYHRPGQRLNISDTAGFTWGRATYVTPLAFPLSTAIFGRVGVIARFDYGHWRTFDATNTANQRLYLSWLQAQAKYREFVLTAQSAYYSQILRDTFRRRYHIDCVLFRPDQSNPRYTNIASDVWMAVTDWRPGKRNDIIATGLSGRFLDARLTVVLEEEFVDQKGGIHRRELLNLAGARPGGNLADLLWRAYNAGDIVRIPS
jgi:hypothetical protein